MSLFTPGVPCTCPLCTSDRRNCVTTSEGVQLAKELGATYLELHTLNDFYIQKYFGGVVSEEPLGWKWGGTFGRYAIDVRASESEWRYSMSPEAKGEFLPMQYSG